MINELEALKSSPAGQHQVPIQEEHHLAGNEPSASVLVPCKKAFLSVSGLS